MARERRQRTRRPNAKFYVFVGTVTAVVILIVFLLTNISTVTVEQGEIRFEDSFPVVIVRDEKVISEENEGKANFLVPEGSRVEADRPVAEVYKWGYQDKVVQELTDQQNTIAAYQQNELLKNGEDQQFTALNESIDKKAAEVSDMISTGVGDLLLAERELRELIKQRQEYLKETVPRDSMLEEYYSNEQLLQDRIEGWRQEVRAPQAGVVSFYFDGAEKFLNADNLQQITSADINDILNGTIKQQESGDALVEQPLYRLVNNYKWYMLIESPVPLKEFSNGTVFDIAFDQYPARQYQGTVVGNISEETGQIYVVEVLDDIGELLSTRRTDARMFTKFEGLKVPLKAITEQNGIQGVTVVENRQRTFVPVEVKISKDGSAIVVPTGDAGTFVAGDKVEV